jgi:glycosyltransferase involved in cell wall biosynthesis
MPTGETRAPDRERATYLMVIAVSAHRIDDGHFAVESAFASHLKLLKARLGSLGAELVLAGPTFGDDVYQRDRSQLDVIDENAEGIRFHGMFPIDAGRLGYLRRLPSVMRALYREVARAAVVQASPSVLYRPFEFPSLMIGRALGKKTISITDIDGRRTAAMNYQTGAWSKMEYLVTRYLHDPFRHWQHLVAARACSLVLLKGEKLARDYGRGRPNVKSFLDSAFSSSHVIAPDRLEEKLRRLEDPASPIAATFFGRLVAYKGVDHMLRAIAHAKDLGLRDVRFEIVGSGPAEPRLRALAGDLGLGAEVVFQGAVAFGDALFERLRDYHVLLAAPLREDTPRSALDAMASGQAVLAYDTYYYRELTEAGAGVEIVPWRDERALGQRLFDLGRDRARLAKLIRQGVAFAQVNTQEIWIDRRMQWTRELFGQ